MTNTLEKCIQFVIAVFANFFNSIFQIKYPAMTISIGAVLLGILLIDLGFEYLNFFGKSKDKETNVRYKK